MADTIKEIIFALLVALLVARLIQSRKLRVLLTYVDEPSSLRQLEIFSSMPFVCRCLSSKTWMPFASLFCFRVDINCILIRNIMNQNTIDINSEAE